MGLSRAVAPRFDPGAALARADRILALAPSRSHIVRPPLRGQVVARFALPLDLCPTLNAFAEWPSWRRAKCKQSALAVMLGQSRRRWEKPLPGRPLVVAIRFSSVEPDGDAGWQKVPVDRLTVKRGGLGLIADDRGAVIERVTWWEYAPKNQGCVVIEVRAGA